MIYLAESGSTKCDAVILTSGGEEVLRLSHMGFNPYFHSSEFIAEKIGKVPEVREYGKKIDKVYFFGAGCSSESLNKIVEEGLRPAFPNAGITIDHDLKSCAFATYSGEPAVSCILGTGSNCVYFDGTNVREGVSGLGFIIGDEGSASYIGKNIVRSYLYKIMPESLAKDFESEYGLTKEDIRENIYNNQKANVFLGNLAPFAQKHIEEPFFHDMVFNGFMSFLETQVMYFPEARTVPIHFVGSIAYHFQDILKEALAQLDLKMGRIIQKPLDGLIEYFRTEVIAGSNGLEKSVK